MNTAPKPAYAKPPALEAVIGISFAQPITTDAALATIDRRFVKHYPAYQENIRQNLMIQTHIGADARPVHNTHEQSVRGHKRMTSNMDEVAILMPDTLTVAQLAPYQGWDAFFARFQRDLALYKRPRAHRSLSRVGMRYINRIDMPVLDNQVEHERYLNIYPQVPDALGPLSGYSMTSTFRLERIGCLVNINTAPAHTPVLGHASFLLDIDVFRTADLPLNDANLFTLLAGMRDEKNRIFEACVTERARTEIFGYANA